MISSTDSGSEELSGKRMTAVLAPEKIEIQGPRSQISFPFSILLSTIIYCGEIISALYMFGFYQQNNEKVLMSFTIGIIILEAVLNQETLKFLEMHLTGKKAALICSHILFLGPIVSCLHIITNYIILAKKMKHQKKEFQEDSEITIMLKKEDVLSISKINAQCMTFKCMSVIQAFMCSVPQLIAQLYISFTTRECPLGRAFLLTFSLLSVLYGAIVCNILSIQFKYVDAKLHPIQYLHITIWRTFEITSRVVTVVLFITSLKLKSMCFLLASFSISFFTPWMEFWRSGTHHSHNRKKRQYSKCKLLVITLLYAAVDFSCWPPVKLQLSHEEIIDKRENGVHRALHYIYRFLENMIMVLVFRFDGRKTLLNCCDSLIAIQLILTHLLSFGFMLIFYEYLCPCSSDLAQHSEDQPEEL